MNDIMNRMHFLDIGKRQIIGITTDNASNMIAMVKRFNRQSEHDVEAEEPVHDDSLSSDVSDESEKEDDTVLNELLDENQEFVAIIENQLSEYALETMNIYGIRCAAHTLQLAVHETIENSKYGDIIELFRDVCKYLRKPTNIRRVKQQGIDFSVPRIDVTTRWSSLYRMVCYCYCGYYLNNATT